MLRSFITQTAFLAFIITTSVNGQCVTDETVATFEFTDKVTVTKSKTWSITYNGTYKVLTNINAQESYVLYQCGSVPPTDTGIDIAIEIPIRDGYAVTQTTSIPFLSQLGQIENGLKVFGNDPLYISDPCVVDAIDSGSITVAPNASFTLPEGIESELNVAFGFPFDTLSVFANSTIPVVSVSEFAETEGAAAYEWIKFYSTFFNLEAQANTLFAQAEAQYTCTVDNVNTTTGTTVMYASYSEFCGGWDVTFPCESGSNDTQYQYACEYATACGFDLVAATERSIVSAACGNRSFLSTEEFATFGENIDVWIYPSPDWNETYANFSTELSSFSSVTNREVYDTQAKGDNDWFEKRIARYFDVLSNFCTVGTTLDGETGWFRNVFTDPIDKSATCSSDSVGLEPFDYTCGAVSVPDASESDMPSSIPSTLQKDVPSMVPEMRSDRPSIVPSILPTDGTLSSPSVSPNTILPTANKAISNAVVHLPNNLGAVFCAVAAASIVAAI